jgi:hypothetical protein
MATRTGEELLAHMEREFALARGGRPAPVHRAPLGEDDELAEPATPEPTQPATLYKRARDLAGTVFPVSEAVILAAARKAGIGRKFGRSIVFSPDAVHKLYEVLPCPSGSSAAPSRRTGSYAAPCGASALQKLQARLTAAGGNPDEARGRNPRRIRPRSSS